MVDELVIDLTNYKDRTGAHVPEDRYRVQVEDIEITKSRNDNDMIVVYFRILGGEYDGYTVIDRLTQSEGALFRTVNFMQAIGLPTPKKRLLVRPSTWVGKVLDVDVSDGEPYMGRVKSEVRGYLKAEQSASAGADLEDLEDLTAAAAEPAEPARVTVPPTPADEAVDLDTIEL